MLRRIVYYERNTKIKNPNPKFKNLEYSRQDLIDFVLFADSVSYIFKDNDIDSWKGFFKDETNCYLINSSSVGLYYKAFKQKKCLTLDYATYREFCKEDGYKPFSRQNYDEMLSWIQDNYCDEEMLKNKPKVSLPPF